jgi:NAD(P)-dependent dehydrogenase (short-subunit alcohol dehydrogenase family)
MIDKWMIMKKLEGKSAIITGAAGGIGKAAALLFAEEGASVLATDIQIDILEGWSKDESPAIVGLRQDVASASDWNKVVETAVLLFGKIDILVNNAGIFHAGSNTENCSTEEWHRFLETNLSGPFLGVKAALPFLKLQGGSIVNVASIAAMVGGNGPAYSASKGGLRMLTRDMAIEFAPFNIRVNGLYPGGVLTPMTENILSGPEGKAMIEASCPMRRLASPEEMAKAILFLASEDSSFATGSELVIDGGLTAR